MKFHPQNKTNAGDQVSASCAGIENNWFVVSYEFGTDIYARIFNTDLTIFKDEFIVNTYLTNIKLIRKL
jgi:hypothetical protein